MSLTVAMISPTACVFSLRATMFSATSSTCSRMDVHGAAGVLARPACPALLTAGRGLGGGGHLLGLARRSARPTGHLVHGGGDLLHRGRLLLGAGRLLLGRGQDLGRRGVEVLRDAADLPGHLVRPCDHLVERLTQAGHLVAVSPSAWCGRPPAASGRPARRALAVSAHRVNGVAISLFSIRTRPMPRTHRQDARQRRIATCVRPHLRLRPLPGVARFGRQHQPSSRRCRAIAL